MSPYTYCGTCAKPLKKAGYTYVCPEGHETHNNPKSSTGVLIFNEAKDSVLLAIRKYEPSKGKVDIIGGFLEFNEDPVDGAKREVMEESRLDIEIEGLVGVYNSPYTEYVSSTAIIYAGRIFKGQPNPDDDVAKLKWFSLNELPDPEECAWPYMPQMFADLKKII